MSGQTPKGVPLPHENMFFARRLCARGSDLNPRTLPCYKLGLQGLRNGVKRVNKRLPERLQLANPTGHIGP
jgi:hypothetical protein